MTASQTTGVLNILKPAGPTSHDVVANVRRVFHQRRVGHAGTLDPAARGVLLVGLGQATRVLEYLGELPKTYRAGVILGVSTDTHDGEGKVTRRAPWKHIRWEMVRDALGAFQGDIMQTPPMYAALKRNGRPLYALARQGITVSREPRPVRIHTIKVLAWLGTRDRLLARDLCPLAGARSGGCAGHWGMPQLTGTHSHWRTRPPPRGLVGRVDGAGAQAHLPTVRLSPAQAQSIRHGQSLRLHVPPSREPALALDEGGRVVAILVRHEGETWHPTKVLMPATDT